MATRSIKGMSGILKPFYNNNKDIKKGKGSKQPINLRSLPNPKDAVPTLSPIILKIGNP